MSNSYEAGCVNVELKVAQLAKGGKDVGLQWTLKAIFTITKVITTQFPGGI